MISNKLRLRGFAQTLDGVPQAAAFTLADSSEVTAIPVPENSVAQVTAAIMATNGAAVAGWDLKALGKRGGGDLVPVGDAVLFTAFKDVAAVANGAFSVMVTGAAGVAVQWDIELEVRFFQP